MNEISEYKGNKIFEIWNEQYPDTKIRYGRTKWKLILDNIEDIREFVNDTQGRLNDK